MRKIPVAPCTPTSPLGPTIPAITDNVNCRCIKIMNIEYDHTWHLL